MDIKIPLFGVERLHWLLDQTSGAEASDVGGAEIQHIHQNGTRVLAQMGRWGKVGGNGSISDGGECAEAAERTG